MTQPTTANLTIAAPATTRLGRAFPYVCLVPVVVSLGVALLFPVSWSTPVNNDLADQLLRDGRLDDMFLPVGYTLLLAAGKAIGNMQGVVALQWIVYLTTLWLTFRTLVALDVSRKLAFVGTVLVGLDPYVLIYVGRIGDAGVSSALFLAFVYLLLILRQRPTRQSIVAIVLGVVCGVMLTVRGNFASTFLVVPVIAMTLAMPWTRRLAVMALIGVGAFAAYVLVTVPVYGELLFASNGPYNLFAGNNEFAADALLSRLNAEPSIPLALAAHGIADSGVQGGTYADLALGYIGDHPGNFVELIGIKLLTLFRPDFRQIEWSIFGIGQVAKVALQIVNALPVFVWLVVRASVWFKRRVRPNWLIVASVVLYVLPFLVTNSDPRFRLPIDLLFIIDAVVAISTYRRAGANARVA